MRRRPSSRHPPRPLNATDVLLDADRELLLRIRRAAQGRLAPREDVVTSSLVTRSNTRERMCDSKTRFRTPEHIARVAGEMGMRWYFCVFCHCYHLTSKPA